MEETVNAPKPGSVEELIENAKKITENFNEVKQEAALSFALSLMQLKNARAGGSRHCDTETPARGG